MAGHIGAHHKHKWEDYYAGKTVFQKYPKQKGW
jgi:hypothetical protein